MKIYKNSSTQFAWFFFFRKKMFEKFKQSMEELFRFQIMYCSKGFYLCFKLLRKSNMKESQRKYQEIKKIGQGVRGSVFLAQDIETKSYVAIKKLKINKETQGVPLPGMRQQSLLKVLKHENVIKMLGVQLKNSEMNLILELAQCDLLNFLKKEQNLNPMRIKSLIYQLLKGIEYLHSNEILHRDLKPQNLLIFPNHCLKISDFDWAISLGIPIDNFQNQVVTLWYRPPDVLLGNCKYDYALDIWSIGCIMAEMFNTAPLFAGNSSSSQLEIIFHIRGTPNEQSYPELINLSRWNPLQYRKTEAKSLRELIPKCCELGVDLVERMLQINPKSRISAKEALTHKYFDDVPAEIKGKYL